jgi:outer membrane protein assembly factor BamD
MFRRLSVLALLGVLLLIGGACTNKKVKNPLADVGSKQPDKVLFDRAVDAMQHRKYDVARLSLQTLINTYPDSEYVARAKLGIADSWYAEGGSAALTQAENEYKDFITFFPNMPEAAEAQLKVADIHYRQMEKADRDYTHAKRAEEEYRQVLLQFPDSKLAETARIKLLAVQEILAEREFRIGRFYYMKESWTAAIARLKSLTDSYPLYSKADEALFMLGDANEHSLAALRAWTVPESNVAGMAAKNKLIREYTDAAAEAYSKIITRYPVMGRADDARKRLEALDRPIPKPTEDAIAQNKKEQEGRVEPGRIGRIMENIHRHPDTGMAAKYGEPTLVDPKQTDAPAMIRSLNDEIKTATEAAAKPNSVSVETVKDGKIPESEAVPRSDGGKTADPATPLKQAPPQVNEAVRQDSSATDESTASSSTTDATAKSDDKAAKTDDKKDPNESSSKKKKKKGLHKLIPF